MLKLKAMRPNMVRDRFFSYKHVIYTLPKGSNSFMEAPDEGILRHYPNQLYIVGKDEPNQAPTPPPMEPELPAKPELPEIPAEPEPATAEKEDK